MSDAEENCEVVERLYAALGAGDTETILAILTPDFVGRLTEGLPNQFGGTYQGSEAMLRDGWGRVGRELDITPVPEQLLPSGDLRGRVGRVSGRDRQDWNRNFGGFRTLLDVYARGESSSCARSWIAPKWWLPCRCHPA